jgi:hypothetical protein
MLQKLAWTIGVQWREKSVHSTDSGAYGAHRERGKVAALSVTPFHYSYFSKFAI